MVYLFVGQDPPSKEIKLNKLKQETLSTRLEQFNLDIIYAKDLKLAELQEKLLFLPVQLSSRMVVIKNAQDLKPEIKDFLAGYAKRQDSQVTLVLDIDRYRPNEKFIGSLGFLVKVARFKEEVVPDTFSLSREIHCRRPSSSLKILKQLLKNGERPEMILGGLRADWERNLRDQRELECRLRSLLTCDIEIKTGKLKPVFALEKLIVGLCKPAGRSR